jgi:hypothetical protein
MRVRARSGLPIGHRNVATIAISTPRTLRIVVNTVENRINIQLSPLPG